MIGQRDMGIEAGDEALRGRKDQRLLFDDVTASPRHAQRVRRFAQKLELISISGLGLCSDQERRTSANATCVLANRKRFSISEFVWNAAVSLWTYEDAAHEQHKMTPQRSVSQLFSTTGNLFKSIREKLVRTTLILYLMGSGSSAQSNDVFDYQFSGISVWLEPGEEDGRASNGMSPLDRLKMKMGDLAETCGGPPHGLYPFQPHCTVLYNMPKASVLEHSALDASDHSEFERLKDASSSLLDRCLAEYATLKKEDGTDHLLLRPTSIYAVAYPPFRCSISLFMLELTRDMDKLHKIACKVFPPDERHQQGGTLHPHISLIYAPTNSIKLLQADANKLVEEEPHLMKPLRAKYLSVWSTEGTISDWKRIARVEIP